MLKPEFPSFNTVRATWEAQARLQEDTSPSKPLLSRSNTLPLRRQPNGVRGLSSKSFTMFNGQFNIFRSSRGRQSSGDGQSSSKNNGTASKTSGNHSKSSMGSSFRNITSSSRILSVSHPIEAPYMALNTAISNILPLPRNKTTSYLPLPKSPTASLLVKQPPLVCSQSTSQFRSCIPTPPSRPPSGTKRKASVASRAFSGLRRPSLPQLQKFNTQPNLTTLAGRKASEIPRHATAKQNRSEGLPAGRQPLIEEVDEFTSGRGGKQKLQTHNRGGGTRECDGSVGPQGRIPQSAQERNRVVPIGSEFGTLIPVAQFSRDSENKTISEAPPTVRPLRQMRKSEPSTRFERHHEVEEDSCTVKPLKLARKSGPQLSPTHVIKCHQLLSPIQPKSPSIPHRSPPVPSHLSPILANSPIVQRSSPVPLGVDSAVGKKRRSVSGQTVPPAMDISVFAGHGNPHPSLQPLDVSPLRRSEWSTEVDALPNPWKKYAESGHGISRMYGQEQEVADSDHSPSHGRITNRPTEASIKFVSTTQSPTYWAGRFMGLKDKILNDINATSELEDIIKTNTGSQPNSSNASSASLIFLPTHPGSSYSREVQQANQIFNMLESICKTEPARRSLIMFRNRWATNANMPMLQRHLTPERNHTFSKQQILPRLNANATPFVSSTSSAYTSDVTKADSDSARGDLGDEDDPGSKKLSFMDRLKKKAAGRKSEQGQDKWSRSGRLGKSGDRWDRFDDGKGLLGS